jgi:hypothetical protein
VRAEPAQLWACLASRVWLVKLGGVSPTRVAAAACRPQPAYFKSDGSWVPSRTNFTSLATPSAVGSGRTALVTLLHEGGEACAAQRAQPRSTACCLLAA